jgi:predicted amidohydrolase YtcJ
MDKYLGTIEPGKNASFTIMDQNLFTTEAKE